MGCKNSWQNHSHGMKSVIDALPKDGQFFVSLDVDGLDPTVILAPLLWPLEVLWWELVELFEEK